MRGSRRAVPQRLRKGWKGIRHQQYIQGTDTAASFRPSCATANWQTVSPQYVGRLVHLPGCSPVGSRHFFGCLFPRACRRDLSETAVEQSVRFRSLCAVGAEFRNKSSRIAGAEIRPTSNPRRRRHVVAGHLSGPRRGIRRSCQRSPRRAG